MAVFETASFAFTNADGLQVAAHVAMDHLPMEDTERSILQLTAPADCRVMIFRKIEEIEKRVKEENSLRHQ